MRATEPLMALIQAIVEARVDDVAVTLNKDSTLAAAAIGRGRDAARTHLHYAADANHWEQLPRERVRAILRHWSEPIW